MNEKRIFMYGIAAAMLIFMSCASNQSKTTDSVAFKNHSGLYVSEGYAQRAEGYDWVSVQITQVKQDSIQIAVRSRSDIKKPTCTFDGKAGRISDDVFKCMIEGQPVLYTFTDNALSIFPEDQKSEKGLYALQFNCSGGGSMAGIYTKAP